MFSSGAGAAFAAIHATSFTPRDAAEDGRRLDASIAARTPMCPDLSLFVVAAVDARDAIALGRAMVDAVNMIAIDAAVSS